jgi:hypothetical protein
MLCVLLLGRRYQEKFFCIEEMDRPLFERMIFDPQMELVWKAILKRSDEIYPFMLFDIIATLLKFEMPSCSSSKGKLPWNNLIQQCKETREAIKLIPDKFQINNLDSYLIRQEAVAYLMLNACNLFYHVFQDVKIRRFDLEFPQRTLLARALCKIFKEEFDSPLWGTIATLVEVSLDLPINTVSIDWIRSCCNNY